MKGYGCCMVTEKGPVEEPGPKGCYWKDGATAGPWTDVGSTQGLAITCADSGKSRCTKNLMMKWF